MKTMGRDACLSPCGKYRWSLCRCGPLVIAAWGDKGGSRARQVIAMLAKNGQKLHCLGMTKDGHPRHPLYLKGTIQPVAFFPPAMAVK